MRPFENRHEVEATVWRLSAEKWKAAYFLARKGGLYAAVPGLCCAVGVVVYTDAPWWVNASAGATIASAAGVILSAAATWRADRKDVDIDKAMVERLWEQEGRG